MNNLFYPVLILLVSAFALASTFFVLKCLWSQDSQKRSTTGMTPTGVAPILRWLRVFFLLLAVSSAFTLAMFLVFGEASRFGLEVLTFRVIFVQLIWATPSALFYSFALIGLSQSLTFAAFFRRLSLALIVVVAVLLLAPFQQLRVALGYVLQIFLGLAPLSSTAIVERITISLGTIHVPDIGFGESIPLAICIFAYGALRFFYFHSETLSKSSRK